MVQEQIASRNIRDRRLLDAMRRIPRHCFIPPATDSWFRAYSDSALPIGEGQTISQPYMVALMTASLELQGTEKTLEIGAGSGYQTAILSTLTAEVIAVERIPELAERARAILAELGCANVHLFVGDGSQGWPEAAPYDAILVAAVGPQVPSALLAQLAPGGRMVLPVGSPEEGQNLLLVNKSSEGTVTTRSLGEVAFVPLIGAQGFGLPADLGDMDI